jgi:CDP-diacylglycerol--glycerol-3-phosphate 3-phosphatidyltransferase
MFSKVGRDFFAKPVALLADRLHSLGVTPNSLTYTGFALTLLTAVFLARGQFIVGALMLIVASLFDMLDGAVARLTKQISTFGAFIDSTLDRYSESVTFLALAFHYSRSAATRTELILVFVIIVGSLMVSYTRARAEGLQLQSKSGMLQRPERIVLLILGLLTGWMQPVLWLMAILTNVSAIQRIYEVYWQTNTAVGTAGPADTVPADPSADERPTPR